MKEFVDKAKNNDAGIVKFEETMNKKKALMGDQKTYNIVDYLESVGLPSSQEDRRELAENMGIKNYKYTSAQNLFMLAKIKQLQPDEILNIMKGT